MFASHRFANDESWWMRGTILFTNWVKREQMIPRERSLHLPVVLGPVCDHCRRVSSSFWWLLHLPSENCCAMVLLLDLLLIVVLLTNSHLLHWVHLCVNASICRRSCWCTTDSCEHHGQAQEVGLRLHHDLCPTMRGAVELLLRNEGCWWRWRRGGGRPRWWCWILKGVGECSSLDTSSPLWLHCDVCWVLSVEWWQGDSTVGDSRVMAMPSNWWRC